MEKKCGCKKEEYQKPTVEQAPAAEVYGHEEKNPQVQHEPFVGYKVCLEQSKE